ncbi:hypothetical protein [Phenylobacterium aquaticum]|uniref:hypothetical protein n=1 Tax=Phenylobacterium aquaticum TaxID=1763816 RepID=UPI001F5D69DF|nr:hypothetical protein [Phenylobacterium aquaticum]MCI3131232.1 hypothetical protein [Phenylobacterium aquaticum]
MSILNSSLRPGRALAALALALTVGAGGATAQTLVPRPLGAEPSLADRQLEMSQTAAASAEANARDAQARTQANLKAAQDMSELKRPPPPALPDLMPSQDLLQISPAADARSKAMIAANLSPKR